MRLTPSLIVCSWCAGCALFQQLEVQAIATSFQKPSNVAAYVAVRDEDQPLTELTSSNFRVYENEQLVPSEQTQLTLLERGVGAAHHVLLLVDMSGARTKEDRALTAKAALAFVEKVSPEQDVSVYAFDGGAGLTPIADVSRGSRLSGLPALESFSTKDASRNLNGAVVAALGKLDAQLLRAGKVVKLGTLVVFSSGPDVAGRVDDGKLNDALSESPHELLAIGIAEQADALGDLGRRGIVRSQSAATLPVAFEEAGEKALSELGKYYLVAYCSPARAGTRRLRLEVSYTTKQGEEHTGDFETDFDANGFGPGCDSATAPRFVAQAKPKPEGARKQEAVKGPSQPSASKPADPAPGDDAPVAPPDQSGYAK